MSVIVLVHTVVGATLALARPARALAILLGFVAVSSSLWWQLGFANLSTPFVYCLALALGFLVRASLTRAEKPEIDRTDAARGIRAGVVLTVLTVGVASLLALVRGHATTWPVFLGELRAAVPRLALFNPGGLAGELQASMILISGPVLLWMALRCVGARGAHQLLQRPLAAGMVLAVTAPALQVLFLDPSVRPDRGLERSTGLVGFFQDPHSFAAYLLVGISVAAGAALGHWRSRQRAGGAAYATLALIAGALLLGTGSLTGLVGVVLALGVFAVVWRAGSSSGDVEWKKPVAIGAAVAAVGTMLVIAVFSLPSVRQSTYETLRGVGLNRLAAPLRDGVAPGFRLGHRPIRWQRGMVAISERPLWGLGPDQFRRLQITPGSARRDEPFVVPRRTRAEPTTENGLIAPENAHNYFLQLAAEYGLPALCAWLFLVGCCLRTTWQGALGHGEAGVRALLAGVLAAQVGLLGMSLLAHPLLLAELQAVFWTVSGLAVAAVAGREPPAVAGRPQSAAGSGEVPGP